MPNVLSFQWQRGAWPAYPHADIEQKQCPRYDYDCFTIFVGEPHGLELKEYFEIVCAVCEVVGHGVLLVCDVGYPVVGADIVDVEDVEEVCAEPYILERTAAGMAPGVEQAIAEAYVGAAVGWCAEIALLYALISLLYWQLCLLDYQFRHLSGFL